ncbi:unnamed protein product [Ostreobium quekettii]|uniref:Calponin-homology (CH) domain-containing protein n=1 Tax=Ostreobium quekettii TaxID=121088 RepID=A0A8S1IRG7_9CHLO|nr:unnamed protein product [Ostreobium quekettii]
MSGNVVLPRHVLKWLLGLDLSHPVKNIRRDFSNGFLVAEILSRYFPSDVQMHSFENVSSIERKKSNWHILEAFFKKHLFEVDISHIDDVMNCRAEATSDFLCKLHEALHCVQPPSR